MYFSSPPSSKEGCVVVTFLISPSSRGQENTVQLPRPWPRASPRAVLDARHWPRASVCHTLKSLKGPNTPFPLGKEHSHQTATEHRAERGPEQQTHSNLVFRPDASPTAATPGSPPALADQARPSQTTQRSLCTHVSDRAARITAGGDRWSPDAPR